MSGISPTPTVSGAAAASSRGDELNLPVFSYGNIPRATQMQYQQNSSIDQKKIFELPRYSADFYVMDPEGRGSGIFSVVNTGRATDKVLGHALTVPQSDLKELDEKLGVPFFSTRSVVVVHEPKTNPCTTAQMMYCYVANEDTVFRGKFNLPVQLPPTKMYFESLQAEATSVQNKQLEEAVESPDFYYDDKEIGFSLRLIVPEERERVMKVAKYLHNGTITGIKEGEEGYEMKKYCEPLRHDSDCFVCVPSKEVKGIFNKVLKKA